MKKISLVLLISIHAAFTYAQNIIKEMDNAYTRFIPGYYMKSGEAAIYFSSDEYGYSDGESNYKAEIFDFGLQPLKSFEFSKLQPYTITKAREATGITEKKKTIKREMGIIYEIPSLEDMEARKAAFIKRIFDENAPFSPDISMDGLTASCRIEGTTIYLSMPFKHTENYIPHAKYLQSIEAYLDMSNKYGYTHNYAIQISIYNGEWKSHTTEHEAVSNFYTPRCIDVTAINHWNGGLYLPFSQTFFNEDEKFEYVRYKAEIAEGGNLNNGGISPPPSAEEVLFGITSTDRDGDGEDDCISTSYGIHRTDIEVVSENGDVIYTFPMPDNCEGDAEIKFYKSNDNMLAEASFNWYNNQNEYMQTIRFYRIDKSTGKAKVIREETHISAYPNPLVQGESVVIDLPASTSGQRTVTVTTSGGKTVFKKVVQEDLNKISIPTNHLASGLYLLTLTAGTTTVESCKIIVR